MKKNLLSIFLAAFITVGFTGQSWAFGSRHHHDEGGASQGSSSVSDPLWSAPSGSAPSGSDPLWSALSKIDPSVNNGTTNGDDPSLAADGTENENAPADVVPEPMTFLLLGMGLVWMWLNDRKKRQSHLS